MPRRPKVNDRLAQLEAVAGEFEGWGPAREVLTSVRAVPTVFPQLDVATRIGGWPLQRVCLLHGPSNMGKSQILHGLGLSFLLAGGYYFLVDAEYTTDDVWLGQMLGEHLKHPGMRAKRPLNYDETVEAVRGAVKAIVEAKRAGKLDRSAPFLVGVDSITKLVPEKIIAKIAKDEGGIDGMQGRAAMIKAALTAAWLDELVPQMYEANGCFTMITRESANVNKTGPWDLDYVVKGGKAPWYESSIVARVTRAGWVKHGDVVTGEKHQVEIRKTKVGGKDGKTVCANFHTVLATGGFDRARDVVELALQHGVLEKQKGGAVADHENGERWTSVNDACAALSGNGNSLREVEQRARAAATQRLKDGHDVASKAAHEDGAGEVFG